MVFAAGASEPPGLGQVGQAFRQFISQQTNKNGTCRSTTGQRDFLALTANDASDRIQQMASVRATRLVLGGYSQGAAVIDRHRRTTAGPTRVPAAVAAPQRTIAAIALFGNPSGPRWRADEADPSGRSRSHQPLQQRRPRCSDGNRWRLCTGCPDDQPGGAFRRLRSLRAAAAARPRVTAADFGFYRYRTAFMLADPARQRRLARMRICPPKCAAMASCPEGSVRTR